MRSTHIQDTDVLLLVIIYYLIFINFVILLKDRFIYAAPVVYARGSYFIFGGWADDHSQPHTNTNVIAKFNPHLNPQWSKIGRLSAARYSHGAILLADDQFLVVGGREMNASDRCKLINNDEITCITQEPTLEGYYHWPELLPVDADYCS